MKTWTMPRIAVDTFVPNEYTVSGCDYPEDAILLWSPIKETNGITGWQQEFVPESAGAPAGTPIDANGINEEGVTTVYGGTYRYVRAEDYTTDDTNGYFEITVGPSGRAENELGIQYPAGSVFYKVYGGGIGYGHIQPVDKNFS